MTGSLEDTHDQTAAAIAALKAERDAWKEAALLFRKVAADGVLRLKQGYSYAQAQDRYTKALAAQPDAVAAVDGEAPAT